MESMSETRKTGCHPATDEKHKKIGNEVERKSVGVDAEISEELELESSSLCAVKLFESNLEEIEDNSLPESGSTENVIRNLLSDSKSSEYIGLKSENGAEVYLYAGESSPCTSSGSSNEVEDGTIIWAQEEPEKEPDTSFLKQQTLQESASSKDPHTLWHNATIEMVGSVPSTSAEWNRYCEKFDSSSEESLTNWVNREGIHSIPLHRQFGCTDVRRLDNNQSDSVKATVTFADSGTTTDNASFTIADDATNAIADDISDSSDKPTITIAGEIRCNYCIREQFDRESLIELSETVIRFQECLNTVAGGCISYIRCLDPDQTGYISFELFIDTLIEYGAILEDEVVNRIESWFSSPRGLDCRSLVEALIELREAREEIENQSNDSCEDPAPSFEEEKENQEMMLQNVMSQYEEMTTNALVRIRVAVFEQGILMLDIFRSQDIDNTGSCTRQEFYDILSVLTNMTHELWTLVMFKYCRPFEPHIIPYKPFADDIDCNAKEPGEVLLPAKYINHFCQSLEDRKVLTQIIERMGRTCSLEQIDSLFRGTDNGRGERLLTQEDFLHATSQVRFITITEKELIYKSFSTEREGESLFDYDRFQKCCKFINVALYMGYTTGEDSN